MTSVANMHPMRHIDYVYMAYLFDYTLSGYLDPILHTSFGTIHMGLSSS